MFDEADTKDAWALDELLPQLRSEYDALARTAEGGIIVGEWISIRDALPGLKEKVLFTPICNEGAIYIGELNAVGEHGTAYFAVRSGRYKTCYSASHWMRLPELPKEE